MYAHRKAMDDHVKLAVLAGGQALAADVTDDRLAIRIPNAPGKLMPGAAAAWNAALHTASELGLSHTICSQGVLIDTAAAAAVCLRAGS